MSHTSKKTDTYSNMNTQSSGEGYKIAAYCRLSVEDGNGESNSIGTQKKMIDQYASGLGWEISEYFIDDGFSGTNFERPAFKQMILQIEAKKVNFVITKDLSRLGRNYIEAGRYTDIFFPSYGVRYVAINDNFDSIRGYDDLAPFKHILNDMYSKDLSKKIRSTKKMLQHQGKFCGSIAPYGYERSKAEKNTLAPNPMTAIHVQQMFKMAENGLTNGKIAKVINARGIPTPAQYLHESGLFNPRIALEQQKWTATQIAKILCNPIYIGTLVANRQQKVSFRSEKCIQNSPENFIIAENAHAAIIEENQFILVQSIRQARICAKASLPTPYDFEEMFPSERKYEDFYYGLLKCGNCSSSLVLKKRGPNAHSFYTCSLYNRKGRALCTGHYVDAVFLDRELRNYLEKLKKYVHSKDFTAHYFCDPLLEQKVQLLVQLEQNKKNFLNQKKQLINNRETLQGQLDAGEISYLLYSTIHEGHLANKSSAGRTVQSLQQQLTAMDSKIRLVENFVAFLPLYLNDNIQIDLTLTRIIEKIEVHEDFVESGKTKSLRIFLKHLGDLQLS